MGLLTLAIVAGVISQQGLAAVPVMIGADSRSVPVSVERILADPAEQADSLFAGWAELKTVPRPAGLSEGFESGAVWVRFTVLRRANSASRWWLALSNTMIDRIDVYTLGPGGQRHHWVTGEDIPVAQAAAASVIPAVPLELAEGETRVLVRLETRNALATRLWIVDEVRLVGRETLYSFVGGLLLGGHLVVAGAALVAGWALRERIWFFFSLFVLINALLFLHTLGLPSWMFFRSFSGIADRFNGVLLMLGLASALEFSFRLARAHLEFPRLFRIGSMIVWGFCLPAALLIGAGYFVSALIRVQVVMLVVIPLLLVALFVQWRKGVEAAGIYLVGVGAYALASEVRFFRNIGVAPSAWWTEGLHQVLSIGYLVVLAFGIGIQSRRTLSERNRLAAELSAERSAREAELDFVAMLSHELRTPLATIEASTQVLRRVDSLQPGEREVRYRRIERSVDRLRDLFDRQLSSDRILHKWSTARRSRSDLVVLLAEARQQLVDETKRERVIIQCDLPVAMSNIDRDLILIALNNLLNNALEYGPADDQVVMSITLIGNTWRVAVADHGEPLAASEVPALFSPYGRGSRAMGKAGVGLGLFLIRRIARAHQGDAGWTGSEGSGNEFWIELPAGF